jgi:hypothetical protein
MITHVMTNPEKALVSLHRDRHKMQHFECEASIASINGPEFFDVCLFEAAFLNGSFQRRERACICIGGAARRTLIRKKLGIAARWLKTT